MRDDPLQMQEQLSHLIAQTTTDAFVAIDQQNRVIYWNRGAEEAFGWCTDEIVGKSLDLIVPQIHRAAHAAGVKRLSEGGKPRLSGTMTNVTAIAKCGRAIAIELALTHWKDPVTGLPRGYAAIMRDVSERRQLEAQRDAYQRKLEEQFAAIEATSDGVAMTDPQGFFVYLNHAHCAMFGYPDPSALIGLHWSVLYSAEEARRIETTVVPQVFEAGNWLGEAFGLHREGHIVEQEVALAKSASGGLVCTTRDMGERRRAMRERIRARERLLLAERQELISRAVSGVAHDFANLVAVISASATTLAQKVDTRLPELVRIEDAAKQASAMLELVLAPNRAARQDRALDAKAALANVVELTAVTLKPNHSIQLRAAEDGLALQASGTEFQRVMMNLCSNARDALPADSAGSIDITIEKLHPSRRLAQRMVGGPPEGPCAVITVTDTGCGIEEADLGRIFEPFQTTKSYGTGLGLVVVAEVVAEVGGSLYVRSSSHGTMFQLVWPLAKSDLVKPLSDGKAAIPDLGDARILIVDDNPSVLDLIAAEVGKTGAKVTTAPRPLQALDILDGGPSGWDAVIVDYDMPEMNGAQLAARIRQRVPHLPIILCSALSELEVDVDGSLFDDRITKSAISRSLNHALERVLSGSKVKVQ